MSTFWDSSAVIHLLYDQGKHNELLAYLKSDPKMIVWWSATAECGAAIARLERERILSLEATNEAFKNLNNIRNRWFEVTPSDTMLERMLRIVRNHPLKAADALHLAAAIVAAEEKTQKIRFLSFDEKLKTAASKEGFQVISS